MPYIKIHNTDYSANGRVSQTVSFAAISKVAADLRTADYVPVLTATWEVTADDLAKRPAKGDVLIAPDGTGWHIQKVMMVARRGVWQCQTYSPITDFLPYETINIVRAYSAVSETGNPTIAWRRIKSNLSAKLIREDMLTGKANGEKKLRAYFRDHVTLQKHDLIEIPDGRQREHCDPQPKREQLCCDPQPKREQLCCDPQQYKIKRTRNSDKTHGWTELFLTSKTDPVAVVTNQSEPRTQ